MAAKLHQMAANYFAFHCPGCECAHAIPFKGYEHPSPQWDWNGDANLPTIRPSIFVNRGSTCPTEPACHSFVTDGKIEFLSDSSHKLAGQTVDLPDWE